MNNICIISFYKFVTILDLEKLKIQIENICSMFETKGTILIAPEGINGTIEGSRNNIKKFLETLKNNKNFSDIIPKYSYSSRDSFNRRTCSDLWVNNYVCQSIWNYLLPTYDSWKQKVSSETEIKNFQYIFLNYLKSFVTIFTGIFSNFNLLIRCFFRI